MRRRIFSWVGVPLSVRGLNVQRSTARSAALLNMRAGLALTTVALATEPSGITVNSTSTQPSWCLRTASGGYSGGEVFTTSAARVSPPGAAAEAAGGVTLAVVLAGLGVGGGAAAVSV